MCDCNVAMVPIQKRKAVSVTGFLGVLVFLAGLICLAFNPVLGVLLIILAVVMGLLGGKKTVMVCPKCGEQGATVS